MPSFMDIIAAEAMEHREIKQHDQSSLAPRQ